VTPHCKCGVIASFTNRPLRVSQKNVIFLHLSLLICAVPVGIEPTPSESKSDILSRYTIGQCCAIETAHCNLPLHSFSVAPELVGYSGLKPHCGSVLQTVRPTPGDTPWRLSKPHINVELRLISFCFLKLYPNISKKPRVLRMGFEPMHTLPGFHIESVVT